METENEEYTFLNNSKEGQEMTKNRSFPNFAVSSLHMVFQIMFPTPPSRCFESFANFKRLKPDVLDKRMEEYLDAQVEKTVNEQWKDFIAQKNRESLTGYAICGMMGLVVGIAMGRYLHRPVGKK